MRNNEFRRKTAQFQMGVESGGGTISLPFWPNGKEGNIRGGAAENDDCDYGRAGWKAKKHAGRNVC